MLEFFLIIIILISGSYLGFLLYKRLPDLKNLDISSIADEKQDKTKNKILEAKFFRSSAKIKEKMSGMFSPSKGFFSGRIKKMKNLISDLESQYKEDDKSKNETPKTDEEIIKESEEMISREEFTPAEKNLIGIIARDAKNAKAYELLGELYFKNRSYDQAEEIYKYLIKLHTVKNRRLKKGEYDELETEFLAGLEVDSKVASYYDDLAQVYMVSGKNSKALDVYLKASSVEPNNPKYLDKLISLSIELKDRGLAKRAFNRLKEINPENAKLTEFGEAIEKMK